MTKIRSKSSPYLDDRREQGGGGGDGGLGGLFPGGGGGGGGGGMGFPLPGGLGRGGGLGLPGCGGKMGGGMIGLLVLAAVFILPKIMKGGFGTSAGLRPDSQQTQPVDVPSLNPTNGNDVNNPGTPDPGSGGGGTCDTDLAQLTCGAINDVQEFWNKQFSAAGKKYDPAGLVLFSGSTNTGCGAGNAQTGPFYCPLDSGVYIDLDFMAQLQNMLGAEGDFAAQYIVGHEVGHHIQNLLGISSKVTQLQQQYPNQANAYSVRLELQADCLAGVWASDSFKAGEIADADIEKALNAASAVGDDRIQQKTQGRVDPEGWTHGSAEQRRSWFNKGLKSGNSDSCDTFKE